MAIELICTKASNRYSTQREQTTQTLINRLWDDKMRLHLERHRLDHSRSPPILAQMGPKQQVNIDFGRARAFLRNVLRMELQRQPLLNVPN